MALFSTEVIVADGAQNPTLTPPPEKRSCTDLPGLLLLVIFCVGWTGVALYAFSTGNPVLLHSPVNTAGETCGQGKNAVRPNLLYFDLTQCAGISATEGSCPSPQVCVEECPRTFWTFTQGKSPGLEKFCDNVTEKQMEDKTVSMSKLVWAGRCPAYILPSSLVMSRCIPTFGLERRFGNGKEETKMNAMKTVDGELLNMDRLRKGSGYVLAIINKRRTDEKFFAYVTLKWWDICMTYLFALAMSIFWVVLLSMSIRRVLLTSIGLCLVTIVVCAVSSFFKYSQLYAPREDIFLPQVITSMSSYWYNKNMWLVFGFFLSIIILIISMLLCSLFRRIPIAIIIIQEASKDLCSKKSLFIIPLLQSASQVLLIFFFVTVASFLITSGSAEFRVVDACSSETCKNVDTGDMFALNDVCDPTNFAECTGCPRAQCVHHTFRSSCLSNIVQVFNVLVMIWSMSFVQSLGKMTMAGTLAGYYWSVGVTGVLSSFLRTCKYHLGTVALGSLIPGACCWKSNIRICVKISYVITAVYGASLKKIRSTYYPCLVARNSDKLLGVDLVTTFIILTKELFIVGIALVFTLIIQADSTLESYLYYQLSHILIIVVGVYAITNSFFSVYSSAVDTKLLSLLQDFDKDDGLKDLKQIFDVKTNNLEDESHPLNLVDEVPLANQFNFSKKLSPESSNTRTGLSI